MDDLKMYDLKESMKLNRKYHKQLKNESMIYQSSNKRSLADWFSLPYDSFFELDYNQWNILWDKFNKLVLDDFFGNFTIICEFHHADYNWLGKIPINEIKDLYYIWKRETGQSIWNPKQENFIG